MKQEFIAENKEVGKGRQEKHQNKIKIKKKGLMKQMEEKNKTISVIKRTLEKALMTIGTSEDKEKDSSEGKK